MLILVLLAISLWVPSSFIPDAIVWLYDKTLSASEILCLIIEVVGVTHLSNRMSDELVDRMDDQPELAKVCELSKEKLCQDVCANYKEKLDYAR